MLWLLLLLLLLLNRFSRVRLCATHRRQPTRLPVPGILRARMLEWVAISFSSAWKWKVKVKSLGRVQLLATPWLQPSRLLHPWDFPGKSTGVGCHCLLRRTTQPSKERSQTLRGRLVCGTLALGGSWTPKRTGKMGLSLLAYMSPQPWMKSLRW